MAKAKTEILQINDTDWVVVKKYKNGMVEKRLVKDKIDIWLIGNTGMRNPWRIPDGFKIYVESDMVGRLRSPEDQKAFKRLLIEKGAIGGDPHKDQDASITRKYRLMFSKFGFIYPEITSKDGFDQSEIGPVDDITPLGKVFYHAKTTAMQQECFLRGLMVPMEPINGTTVFSPLLWVLQVMLKLHEMSLDYYLDFIEFAVCVQTTNPSNDVNLVCRRILDIRKQRQMADDEEKFDKELIHHEWLRYCKDEDNFKQYADMNIRYLKATGVIKESGSGITIAPEMASLLGDIAKKAVSTSSLKSRYLELCNGTSILFDN